MNAPRRIVANRPGHDGTGKKEAPLLIIEADGTLIRWQQRGLARKKRKKNKNFKYKTAVVYEGWEIEALFRQKEPSLKTPLTLFVERKRRRVLVCFRPTFKPSKKNNTQKFLTASSRKLFLDLVMGLVYTL
jgi:hypothetical protein